MGSASAATREKTGRSRAKAVAGAGMVATVSVGELRSNFKAVEAKLAKGPRLQVTRRGEVVAEVLAPVVPTVEQRSFADGMPDLWLA